MLRRLEDYRSIVPLLLRLGVGLTFFFSGLGKVMGGTDGVARFFGNQGIPLPGLMAPFVSYLELLGGLALMLGLFTRVFGLLFIPVMLVALLMVNIPGASQEPSLPQAFTQMRTEVLLLLGSACLVILGSGVFGLDHLLFNRDQGDRAVGRTSTA